MNNRCKGCLMRHPACQDTCVYSLENKAEREKIKKIKWADNLYRGAKIEIIAKTKRKAGLE